MFKITLLPVLALFLAGSFVPFANFTDSASALSGSQFKAGNIMSDGVFFNGSALSASQIQNFLNAKVPNCDSNGDKIYSGSTTRKQYAASNGVSTPFICLKSYKQNTPSRSDSLGLCKNLSSKSNRTAARIIDDVARACGVSQKALIVLLEKEQSLVTDDWPWPIQYRSATGFGCPDDEGAVCDSQYYGFFNQVYHAARQFKRYAKFPDDYNHVANQNNSVRYHPNSSCGSSTVNIQNQTTAGLYNYTPYQPNQAALNNLYGTGNNCSSYGNRNFWRIFNDWFGSTQGNPKSGTTLVGDWDGDGKYTTGLKVGKRFYLDNDNDGFEDITFGFGRSSDVALVGDWNGDGKHTVALKRGRTYFFDYDNNGNTDATFGFGRAGDIALVGDWNGDDSDTIGLKRGRSYFFDHTGNGSADTSFSLGKTNDIALVGDWNGDDSDTIGLKRGRSYFFDHTGNGSADTSFSLGKTNDIALVGDWNDNGNYTIGLKRGNEHFLDFNNNGSVNVSFTYFYY
jgi:hypothetical protein